MDGLRNAQIISTWPFLLFLAHFPTLDAILRHVPVNFFFVFCLSETSFIMFCQIMGPYDSDTPCFLVKKTFIFFEFSWPDFSSSSHWINMAEPLILRLVKNQNLIFFDDVPVNFKVFFFYR